MKKAFRELKKYLKENMNNDGYIYKKVNNVYHK